MVGFVAFVLLWKQTEILVEMDFAPYENFFCCIDMEAKAGLRRLNGTRVTLWLTSTKRRVWILSVKNDKSISYLFFQYRIRLGPT
jgi:hypothetical protein